MNLSAHDLLRLAPDAPAFSDAPAWVARSLTHAPFVVVRRAPALNGTIPVGVRGAARSERFGTWIGLEHVCNVVKPESLIDSLIELNERNELNELNERNFLPAFALLRAIRPVCDATGLVWGPTGSVGFELASGVPSATQSSDLDVLLRAPLALSRDASRALFDELTRHAAEQNARIDIQIETPNGAFSLAEFTHAGARVMMRSADGPTLVADPWQHRRCAA